MPSLSFKKRFSPLILSLIKKQTIRAPRRRPIQPGDTLYLYEALRTKHSKHLIDMMCKNIFPIRITSKSIVISKSKKVVLSRPHELNQFAQADGFDSWADMKSFWISTHGKEGSPFPFTGTLITW